MTLMAIEFYILFSVLVVQVLAALFVLIQVAKASKDLNAFIASKAEDSIDGVGLSLSESHASGGEGEPVLVDGNNSCSGFDWNHISMLYGRLPSLEQPSALLEEFQFYLRSIFSYQLLERIFIVAPLIGVLITCVGFTRNGIDPDDLQESMLPLLLGVGGGASLALVNQILLFFISWRLERFNRKSNSRLRAVCYQDEGERLREISLANLGKVIEALEQSATYHEKIVTYIKDNIEQVIVPNNIKVTNAVTDISDATSLLLPAIKEVVSAAHGLNARMGVGLTDFDNLSGSIALLRDILDQQLGKLISKQSSAVERLTESAKNLEGSTKELDGSARGFDTVISTLNTGLQKVDESTRLHSVSAERILAVLESELQPSFSKIKDAINSLSRSKDLVEKCTENTFIKTDLPIAAWQRSDEPADLNGNTDFQEAFPQDNAASARSTDGYPDLVLVLKDLAVKLNDLIDELKSKSGDLGKKGFFR